MNSLEYRQYIASLIAKEALGLLTDREKSELHDWVGESAENRSLYLRLKGMDYSDRFALYGRLDTDKAFFRYTHSSRKSGRHLAVRWISVAAVLVATLAVAFNLLQVREERLIPAPGIQPGCSQALLVLEDGTTRTLDSLNEVLFVKEDKTVRNTGTRLIYSRNVNPSVAPSAPVTEYNVLTVPLGGEYQLELEDGTKVWLNSQSSLRFPVHFGTGDRVVYLSGEAYFEVSKDARRPFAVRISDELSVNVLGTSFNVRAYKDETVQTVLEDGSVQVCKGSESATLVPGELAEISSAQDGIAVSAVSTELYTSWRSGQYIFQNETLENILGRLSKWYKMDVFYQNDAARKVVFSGNIQKYETIGSLLEALELSGGVRFSINGSTIIVTTE